MLQPFPVRPFFRFLEFPLSVVIIAAGGVFVLEAWQIFADSALLAIAVLFGGIAVATLGGLAMIHAVTGGFPEWAVRSTGGSNYDFGARTDFPTPPSGGGTPTLADLRKLRRWLRFARIFAVVGGTGVVLGIADGIWKLPAATVPALLASLIGYWRSKPLISSTLPRDFDDTLHRVFVWGITGGALGYCVLAALKIGLVADGVPLLWRIFGGAVVGASVGVFVSCGVCLLTPLVALMHMKRAT